MDKAVHNHGVFWTTNWYVRLGPTTTLLDDDVFIILGVRKPFLMRSAGQLNLRDEGAGSGMRFAVIGECYVHGIMDGECARAADEQEIFLI
jgi:hypothetical protein